MFTRGAGRGERCGAAGAVDVGYGAATGDDREVRLARERTGLVGLCARITGDRDAAEDLAQETLLEAWRHALELRDPEKRPQWLAGIARNVCRRWMRSRGRELSRRVPVRGHEGTEDALANLPNGEPELEVELERSELAALLDRALALLPPETRGALVERYIHGSPYAEIAARLGLSEDAVAMRLQRGRLSLRRILLAELGSEAASYGLLAAGTAARRETRVWCPLCGTRRLTGRVAGGERGGRLVLRCPACNRDPDESFVEADLSAERVAGLASDVRGYRSALSRSLGAIGRYFEGAGAARAAPCLGCGRPCPVAMAAMLGGRGMHVRCAACGSVSNCSAAALALSLPEGQRFWREHGRIRALPEREAEGGAAIVSGFESVAGSAALRVLRAASTYELIAVRAE